MVNKHTIIGNVGRDAEVRFTGKQQAVANFSIATTETYGQGADKKERTDWHNIVAWGKLGEFCGEYVKKGRQLYVEGKVQTRSYEDKNGQKRYSTETVAHTIQLLGKRESQKDEVGEQSNQEILGNAPLTDEDVPF